MCSFYSPFTTYDLPVWLAQDKHPPATAGGTDLVTAYSFLLLAQTNC